MTIDYIDKFSICVNNDDRSKDGLKDRSSQILITLTFMLLYLFLVYDDGCDNRLNSTIE